MANIYVPSFSQYIAENSSNGGQKHAHADDVEKYIAKVTKGQHTSHKAPFDVIDWKNKVGYEVKTMSDESTDKPFHIEQSSYDRKMEYAKKFGLKPVLIGAVVFGNGDVEFYRGEIQQHFRLSALTPVKLGRVNLFNSKQS